MPFWSEGVEPGMGLALSGGVFRATLCYCGALWRLNESGILAKLDRVSSVSSKAVDLDARLKGGAIRLRQQVRAQVGAARGYSALENPVMDAIREVLGRQ